MHDAGAGVASARERRVEQLRRVGGDDDGRFARRAVVRARTAPLPDDIDVRLQLEAVRVHAWHHDDAVRLRYRCVADVRDGGLHREKRLRDASIGRRVDAVLCDVACLSEERRRADERNGIDGLTVELLPAVARGDLKLRSERQVDETEQALRHAVGSLAVAGFAGMKTL